MFWITIITQVLILAAYIYVIQKLLKFELTIRKYISFTDTTHTGFTFRFFTIRFTLHYVKAEKEHAVIEKDIGFSKYKSKGKRGMGFSYYDKSLLFLIKES